jgi:hypothetical protein
MRKTIILPILATMATPAFAEKDFEALQQKWLYPEEGTVEEAVETAPAQKSNPKNKISPRDADWCRCQRNQRLEWFYRICK